MFHMQGVEVTLVRAACTSFDPFGAEAMWAADKEA